MDRYIRLVNVDCLRGTDTTIPSARTPRPALIEGRRKNLGMRACWMMVCVMVGVGLGLGASAVLASIHACDRSDRSDSDVVEPNLKLKV